MYSLVNSSVYENPLGNNKVDNLTRNLKNIINDWDGLPYDHDTWQIKKRLRGRIKRNRIGPNNSVAMAYKVTAPCFADGKDSKSGHCGSEYKTSSKEQGGTDLVMG